jgi:hypothetical protein
MKKMARKIQNNDLWDFRTAICNSVSLHLYGRVATTKQAMRTGARKFVLVDQQHRGCFLDRLSTIFADNNENSDFAGLYLVLSLKNHFLFTVE